MAYTNLSFGTEFVILTFIVACAVFITTLFGVLLITIVKEIFDY